ncbi:M15 family metallopeptidase [Bacillus sp. CGMCC 1.16607]|uniref:M15 family metallopeptidase n=1 Tax=Bacillus sp. CGMCC 1.16607 TaxID=3351842 RepID=UPI003635E13E
MEKILMSDTRINNMMVDPNYNEPFVNLAIFDPSIKIDPTLEQRSRYFSCVRLSIATKLSLAKKLLPEGLSFLLKEGYRPLHVQEMAIENSMNRIKETSNIQEINAIRAEASKYVAPPEVAPHPTGAAVDITLIDSYGRELDLGTPFDAIPHETDYATYFDAENISLEAKKNRKILAEALVAVGFVNYFTEWWHWSYGDKYWAVMTDAKNALYLPVSENELKKLLKK